LTEAKEKDSALERCELELQAHPDQTECRLQFKLFCKQGVVKSYRLYYEPDEVLHAGYDPTASPNHWKVSSRTLRDVVEYFGPKNDQLDWFFKDGKMTFTSYTEQVKNGREILKQPMHTSVALERKDFDDFNVEEGLHIGIVVKDFRAIVAHAETLHTAVSARYARGNRPMQITYTSGSGLSVEFTLMTRSISANAPGSSRMATPVRDLSVNPVSRQSSMSRGPSVAATTQPGSEMPPPAPRNVETQPPASRLPSRNSPPAPSASLNPDSLFIPAEDEDQQWEPNYMDEPDIVTWDNASPSTSNRRLRDSESESFQSMPGRRTGTFHEIAPTQRLSQVKGLFD
jgi:cell cycle checkpoint control protein RAD9A